MAFVFIPSFYGSLIQEKVKGHALCLGWRKAETKDGVGPRGNLKMTENNKKSNKITTARN